MVATNRLSRIQTAMSPKQIVLLYIGKCLRHGSLVEAAQRECREWFAGQTLCQAVEEAIRKHATSRDERVLRSAVSVGQREALFLSKLFSECNLTFETHSREWQLQVSLLVAVSAMWAELARTGRPSRITREELVESAMRLRTNLQAHLLAAKLIGSEYFDGLDILCKGTASTVTALIDDLAFLAPSETAAKGRRRSPPHRDGSHQSAEEAGRAIAKRIIRLVKAQVHQNFGEDSRAAVLLTELMTESVEQ